MGAASGHNFDQTQPYDHSYLCRQFFFCEDLGQMKIKDEKQST
jgi:hypothetical protein